nr:MAG TPA: hypothetical protein [Caudoviricetes sp.]
MSCGQFQPIRQISTKFSRFRPIVPILPSSPIVYIYYKLLTLDVNNVKTGSIGGIRDSQPLKYPQNHRNMPKNHPK